jgi:hypothetical protein
MTLRCYRAYLNREGWIWVGAANPLAASRILADTYPSRLVEQLHDKGELVVPREVTTFWESMASLLQ